MKKSGVVGTDPLGVRVVPVSVFVSQVFAHLCVTSGRLSLEQFRQAVIAEPRLLVSLFFSTMHNFFSDIQESLIPGVDQEEVEISIPTSPTPAPQEQTTYKSGSIRGKKGVESFVQKEETSSDLALAVTDSDAQTPLLSGGDDKEDNEKQNNTASRGNDCCILL